MDSLGFRIAFLLYEFPNVSLIVLFVLYFKICCIYSIEFFQAPYTSHGCFFVLRVIKDLISHEALLRAALVLSIKKLAVF